VADEAVASEAEEAVSAAGAEAEVVDSAEVTEVVRVVDSEVADTEEVTADMAVVPEATEVADRMILDSLMILSEEVQVAELCPDTERVLPPAATGLQLMAPLTAVALTARHRQLDTKAAMPRDTCNRVEAAATIKASPWDLIAKSPLTLDLLGVDSEALPEAEPDAVGELVLIRSGVTIFGRR